MRISRNLLLWSLAWGLSATAVSAQEDSATAVDFTRDVKPILEASCVHCHGPKEQKGDFRIDTKADAFKGGGDYAPGIKPGDTENSAVVWMCELPADDDLVMPPKKQLNKLQQSILHRWVEAGAEWPEEVVLNEVPRMDFKVNILPLLKKGGPFNEKELGFLRMWVEQGGEWPEGFSLAGAAGEEEAGGPSDNLELVEQMREMILGESTVTEEDKMEDYASEIPKTGVPYEMVAIPGGEFLMGSPDTEEGRRDDEGPQNQVKIEPFWMGKYEVTWDMYEPFMITDVARNKDGSPEKIAPDAAPVDIVSSPTTPYTEMSFGMGREGFPAISMTQHAANKFCQWLSAQTGHFYRLPTEAEWEYACRAGTNSAYSFGDDPSKLADYGWFYDNAQDKYQKVGEKLPNPWGLYDMHGNVMEWCLDQYSADTYANREGSASVLTPWVKANTLYPRVARGGSWYDYPEDLRSAGRFKSSEAWKVQDPQLPKSIWYHTDAPWLGFRIVRPLKVPSAQEMYDAWNLGLPKE